jgi:hypothetical protein
MAAGTGGRRITDATDGDAGAAAVPAVRGPAALAAAVGDARARLVTFVGRCTEGQWVSCPLGDADPRSVAVIVDHVADAYEYMGRWVEALVRGEPVVVDSGVVDDLNARHAAGAVGPTPDEAASHLVASGDRLVELIGSLRPEQLDLGEGRVGRLAHIAALHADGHRTELEEALGTGAGAG